MPNYNQTDGNGRVVAQAFSPNKMIEIAELDARQLDTWEDPANPGQFIGHKIVLTSDKSSIAADGVDTATITATVYNWDDTVATDFASDITFSVGTAQTVETPVNGVVTFPFTSAEVGTFTIKSLSDDQYLMTAGSVDVEAV